MTSRTSILVFLFLAAAACNHVPVVTDVSDSERGNITKACLSVYPDGPWNVVHSILVSLPGGGRSVIVGASTWDPALDRLESALMSPEGIVLFQGGWQHGVVDVERALPPLDGPGFAEGLFADVRFMFLPPSKAPDLVGQSGAGVPVCRWSDGDRTMDLLPGIGGGWILREYMGRRLRREAVASEPDAVGFAQRMVLRVQGVAGYRMAFKRID